MQRNASSEAASAYAPGFYMWMRQQRSQHRRQRGALHVQLDQLVGYRRRREHPKVCEQQRDVLRGRWRAGRLAEKGGQTYGGCCAWVERMYGLSRASRPAPRPLQQQRCPAHLRRRVVARRVVHRHAGGQQGPKVQLLALQRQVPLVQGVEPGRVGVGQGGGWVAGRCEGAQHRTEVSGRRGRAPHAGLHATAECRQRPARHTGPHKPRSPTAPPALTHRANLYDSAATYTGTACSLAARATCGGGRSVGGWQALAGVRGWQCRPVGARPARRRQASVAARGTAAAPHAQLGPPLQPCSRARPHLVRAQLVGNASLPLCSSHPPQPPQSGLLPATSTPRTWYVPSLLITPPFSTTASAPTSTRSTLRGGGRGQGQGRGRGRGGAGEDRWGMSAGRGRGR